MQRRRRSVRRESDRRESRRAELLLLLSYLLTEAKKYESKVTVRKDGKESPADSIIGLMGLGAKKGDRLQVEVSGPDEEKAAADLELFFREKM